MKKSLEEYTDREVEKAIELHEKRLRETKELVHTQEPEKREKTIKVIVEIENSLKALHEEKGRRRGKK